MSDNTIDSNYLQNQAKAELHLHIEGSLEPEMLLNLARRNNVTLKYRDINEIRAAYAFNNLQEFLDIYYQGMSVLITEDDFYDLMFAYLTKAHQDKITHSEIFVDPQAHLSRGVSLDVVFAGFKRAMEQAKQEYQLDSYLIPCFLRHLSEDDALRTFDVLMDYRKDFIGIGLDSSELGNPPRKFKNLFDRARKENLKLVAHAGEEGPAEYVWEALEILGVDRVDHGNAITTDKELMARIATDGIGLTMCPLSNQCLQVVPDLRNHQALQLMNAGVKVTVNSDDPAYFGGYLNKNYQALIDSLNLSKADLDKLIRNAFDVKFA